MKLLVTGMSGLIGSESVLQLYQQYDVVHGIDNNMRMNFFGEKGDTRPTLPNLKKSVPNLIHHNVDI